MPIATPFKTLGAGNGFPYCPAKIEVSGYDYWSTLGGFNKGDGGSPTSEQLSLSLVNAMKLYWNYNGHTATAIGTDGGGSGESVDLEVILDLDSGIGDDRYPSDFTGEPKSRGGQQNYWRIDGSDTSAAGAMDTSTSFVIIRMYNSGTFIGFGISGQIYCSGQAGFNPMLQLLSIANKPGLEYGYAQPFDHDVKYTRINDIYFTALAYVDSAGGVTNIAIVESPPTKLEASFTDMPTLAIKDLTFYTYSST